MGKINFREYLPGCASENAVGVIREGCTTDKDLPGNYSIHSGNNRGCKVECGRSVVGKPKDLGNGLLRAGYLSERGKRRFWQSLRVSWWQKDNESEILEMKKFHVVHHFHLRGLVRFSKNQLMPPIKFLSCTRDTVPNTWTWNQWWKRMFKSDGGVEVPRPFVRQCWSWMSVKEHKQTWSHLCSVRAVRHHGSGAILLNKRDHLRKPKSGELKTAWNCVGEGHTCQCWTLIWIWLSQGVFYIHFMENKQKQWGSL